MEKHKFSQIENVEHLINSSDIVVNPETGFAIVVIKPDAFANKEQIISRIKNSGLYVVKTIEKRLPDNFVAGTMYKDLPKGIEEETLKHFNSGPSEIILLKGGNDVLQKIVTLTGEKTDPNMCTEDSIRYLFGEHFMRETSDGNLYSRNAIHRAKTGDEQSDDLEKFKHFL